MSQAIILEGGPRNGEQMIIPDRWDLVQIPELIPLRPLAPSDAPLADDVSVRVWTYARTTDVVHLGPHDRLTVFRVWEKP